MKKLVSVLLIMITAELASARDMKFNICTGQLSETKKMHQIEISGNHLLITQGNNIVVNEHYTDMHDASTQELHDIQIGVDVYIGQFKVARATRAQVTSFGKEIDFLVMEDRSNQKVLLYNNVQLIGNTKNSACEQ